MQPAISILREDHIARLPSTQILGTELVECLYDIPDPLEQARLKAILLVRAKELKIEKEFGIILKAYDKEQKKLSDQYTRDNARRNSAVPLKYDGNGVPMLTIENFLMIIRGDEYFKSLTFNLLTYSPEKKESGKPERWTDTDDSAARAYIESKYHIHNQQKLDDALRIVFREREYHPIKKIIESEKWDGVERIPDFLCKWLKCEDSEYSREVSRLIFSGGINRLYNPGCKFDDMPVLIGTKQGEGKSTFVRWLALRDEFFGEVCEIEGQKGIEALEGIWICEVAELLALTKAKEVEAVKGYLTKLSDRYRRPFDRRVTEHKRQCLFIGTTNKEQFLTDKTGNRRYYPIKVFQNGYDLFDKQDEIKSEILQCWAEAKAKYDKGDMKPYANRDLISEIKRQQLHAVEDDYRDGLILEYLQGRDEICILEIWKNALGNEYSKPTKRDSNDISLILQSTQQWERAEKPKRLDKFGLQKIWRVIPDRSEGEYGGNLLDNTP